MNLNKLAEALGAPLYIDPEEIKKLREEKECSVYAARDTILEERILDQIRKLRDNIERAKYGFPLI